MTALVTGGTGTLGRRVVRELVARGRPTVVLTRSVDAPIPEGATRIVGDLTTGEGLGEAMAGADVVFHCATDGRRHREVDDAGTARLLQAARGGGGPLIVYPGVVGSDVIPLGYYRSKQAAETAIARSGLDWIVLRATQFHQLVWWLLERSAARPVMVIPRDTRAQPIDPTAVANGLVEAAEGAARGRLSDLGGPTAYTAKDLAGSYLAATGRKRRAIQITYPGIVGAAFRAGGNLTPERDATGETWNEFVARKIADR